MAKMRWSKLEWQRKALTHEPLADPHLTVPSERERQIQQSKKKGQPKRAKVGESASAEGKVLRAKRRTTLKTRTRRAGGTFHASTLKAVERVSRERKTRDPAVIAAHLGISPTRASEYLDEIARRT